MARRYEIAELIWLRESPLVVKPTGLPPIEEWMPPDQPTQRKQQTPRDPQNPNETGTGRRPSFFEAKHISRGSNSEDIVLGPPKTAFASSRIGGKGSFDLTPERPVRQLEVDEKNEKFNFRDRFFKDRDATDKDFAGREVKPAPLNGRRGEREDWNAGRPRRTFGPEEQERKPRRNGEFDRWESKEGPRDLNAERTPQKDGRFPPRKDGQTPRSKYEGSWFRDENNPNSNSNNHEGTELDEDKPPLRNREWRQNQTRHGTEREWNRGAKLETEPEWLDTNDNEPRRAHTQEDFERWKERMKAGSGGASQGPPQTEEKREAHAEHKTETHRTDGEIFSNSGTPSMSDNSMERFFGLLGDAKQQYQAPAPAQAPEVSTPNSAESMAKKDPFPFPGKPGKSSRFAGLFSPMPESPAREPAAELYFPPQPAQIQAPPPAPESMPLPSHSADQEGFQRILQMLGGQRSGNSTPQQAPHSQPRHPSLQAEQQRAAMAMSPPSRDPHHQMDFMGSGPEIPLSQAGSKDPQSMERAHLLRLMQQVRVGPSPVGNPSQQTPGAGIAPPPGLMPEGMPRPPPGLPSQKTPSFLDDPAIANMQRPDSEQLRRRPANGPPMGYFDDMPFPQGNQGPMTPGGPITPGGSRPPQGPPMGLPRPPGLDHLPPPGWTGQPGPHQGNVPSPMGPPPGIPTPGRGMNPNFPPGMLPMPGNAPPLNERQAFPRGPPPGMMPPPGYMNGPPPGFPPMPPNPEAMMGLGPGGQGPFGPGNLGPQGPPSSRHLLDMFGQPNGGDPRGGMVGPGPFR